MAYGFAYGQALTHAERIINLEEIVARFERKDRRSYPPIGDLEAHSARARLAELRANPPSDPTARVY